MMVIPAMKKVPVLYLDLDGTVRKGFDELGRFVNCADDVELFPRMRERLWSYKQNDFRIVGVTNQGGIAMGLVSLENVAKAVERTQELCGGAFDQIMVCQHHPDAKDPEYAVCMCRKPRIGLLINAGITMNERYPYEIYPPHLALFIGDRPEDQQCAANAGIAFMWAAEWRQLPFTVSV